ncbi:nucleotidyltransferase family protein [Gloeocapsa sp. PCC 73106]|uniref:nucleotidyltransferase family protein n=1 Tax=Gloeocapsa sp. PCC 73106 TaxID=102232 RepID=UPI0002ABEFB5|nr:hypothetical protein [Gloeocapsa sp. PCC 73106]ELS00005.1 putative nucleotidyltransferase [Gloeocapsa sp. PCC 73106]
MIQSISSAQLASYRAHGQKREQERREYQLLRQQKGWFVARQSAQILKQEFRAKRVKLFGSMLYLKRIHRESDLDIAVEGLIDCQYFQAVTRLLDLSDLSVDLVQVEHINTKLLTIINQEGVDL